MHRDSRWECLVHELEESLSSSDANAWQNDATTLVVAELVDLCLFFCVGIIADFVDLYFLATIPPRLSKVMVTSINSLRLRSPTRVRGEASHIVSAAVVGVVAV